MIVRRGDIVLAWYPFASGNGGKRRPCLVIQNDRDNSRLSNTIVVQITSNLRAIAEPTQLVVRVGTVEGNQSGLPIDSLISCNNLTTISFSRIDRVIGSLPVQTMLRIDDCLRLALKLK